MSLFKDLEIEAFRAGITPRTKASIEWFRKKAGQLGRVGASSVMQDEAIKLTNSVKKGPLGNMYMYYYDPKTKDKLPYYDKFPLIIMYGAAPGGFYGLNLHYLPPTVRAKALDALLGEGEVPGRFIKPAIKRYLMSHVRSRFALVDKPEWEIATFLPTAQWSGAGSGTVYADSRRKMSG